MSDEPIDLSKAQLIYLVDSDTFREYEKSIPPTARYTDVWLQQHGIENLLAHQKIGGGLVGLNWTIIAHKDNTREQ